MLKLLLGHWQAHRKKPSFVLTDDPLYCTHLSDNSGHAHQVYTVSRINPIYEDTDTEERVRPVGKSSSAEDTDGDEIQVSLPEPKKKVVRLPSDSEDNEGEVSNGGRPYTRDSIPMSTDSDEAFESVVVSVDVHRISSPDDVIKANSNHSTLNRRHSLSIYRTDSREQHNGDQLLPGTSVGVQHPDKKSDYVHNDLQMAQPSSSNHPSVVRENSFANSSKKSSSQTSFKSVMADEDARNDIRTSLTKVLQSKLGKPASPVEPLLTVQQVQEEGITRTDSSAGSEEISIP